MEPVGGLTRAKTTINVAPYSRERSATVGGDPSQPSSIRDNDPPAATVLGRSNTANATSGVSRTGLPTRALSVRKPGVNDVSPPSVSPKPSERSLRSFIHIPIYPMCSFSQKRLPGQPTFMIILWTHILSHRRHPSLHKATAIASQIGGIMLQDPQYLGHRVRSEVHPALAPSSGVSHGARLRQAYTTTTKRAT